MQIAAEPIKLGLTPFEPWVWQVPEHFNIGTACADAHLGTPAASRIAMIVEDDKLGTSEITFAELAARTSRFAQLLRDLGVAVQDRVLIRLPNSLDYPTAFLGAMKRGAISVPTSTLLTAEEVLYLAQDSGATVLVTDKAMWAVLKDQIHGVPNLRHILLSGPGEVLSAEDFDVLDLDTALAVIEHCEAPHQTRADDPAYLVYTSGTTGYPKGVLHAHRALIGRRPASRYWFDFAPEGDRIMHSGKFNWTYVLGSGLMDPLYLGKTVIVHEGKNDATTWPKLIAKHNATIFVGVPTIYRQIVQKTEFTKQDVPSLRHCMSAGEHLSDEVLQQWRERFGMDIYEAVGMSEFSYYLCETKSRPIRPGSAGFPQPGHDIRLLDPVTLETVPPGEEGMICVPENDPGLFLEYWNLPEETAKLRHDGWFFTGDYAKYDEDGYIWFLGRKDDIIKSFGYRVSPYEIERVFKSHPDVADCAAVGEEIERDKVLVVAYVIAKPESKITPDELAAYGKQHLAAYKSPKVVYLAKDFPRTKNGKILRRDVNPSIAISRSS
ncbi:acetyl-CoA synthetase [Novimethylophilus kurashikiensis]|uniref:Acetyl-CoA synthetase n=1 Tax=Novimethylophilus kurashikiensis TaxID=1825523 RepID=A0A2R5FAP8_9PROT|nr:class I adenylate-forming enzyme family protein [Novimethylophilus kurashikiensis]GBG14628.1 acetyl-CoA synthetase [Novimethylophilus kurashikiensis]